MTSFVLDAAHGGSGWSPRVASLRHEIGEVWGECGISNEWGTLESVLMHRPGLELESIPDPNKALMFNTPDITVARKQHDRLTEAYRDAEVTVFYVEPMEVPPPNLMFVADLFFTTPEGVILARPASTVRAGEERFVAKKLAESGVPILRCIRGRGTFEGADASWINPDTVLLATGLRTNGEGAVQVISLLEEMGVDVILVELPHAAMHLMGTLRFVDRDLAICWKSRVPSRAVEALREHGYTVLFTPDDEEASSGMALNFVVLKQKQILMPAGNPTTQSFYEETGIECKVVEVSELHKAAGGIACLTGVLKRHST